MNQSFGSIAHIDDGMLQMLVGTEPDNAGAGNACRDKGSPRGIFFACPLDFGGIAFQVFEQLPCKAADFCFSDGFALSSL